MSNANVAYRLTGGGRATVFITQSLGFASAEWWPIQDELSGHARVLSWDRPGYGESGPPLSPRAVGNVAVEAVELLARVAPDGPLVLVGHSQGGLYTNAMDRLAGSRVQAVVLLDPAHPDNSRLRRELPPKLFRGSGSDLSVRMRMARTLARLRLIGLMKPLMRMGRLARADAERVEGLWGELLRDHVNLSPLGQLETVAHTGHMIHLEQPQMTVARIVASFAGGCTSQRLRTG